MDQPHDGAGVELNALLGRGTRYAGNLYFEGRIRLEGHFVGEIRCAETPEDGVLVIGEGAELSGDIEVGVCIVTGGTVKANIRARSAIELHAPSIVRGNLHAPNVFIDRGVKFEGNCRMAPLDAAGDAQLDGSTPDGAEASATSEPIEAPADTDPGIGPESTT